MTNKYKKVLINGKMLPEHLVVAARELGRELSPPEVVHHINGNEQDNRGENLLVLPSRKAHSRIASALGRFLEARELVADFRSWYDDNQRREEEIEAELSVLRRERDKLEKRYGHHR